MASVALLQWLTFNNSLAIPIDITDLTTLGVLLFISIFCAFIELLPFFDDNITVPLAGAVLTRILLDTS